MKKYREPIVNEQFYKGEKYFKLQNLADFIAFVFKHEIVFMNQISQNKIS